MRASGIGVLGSERILSAHLFGFSAGIFFGIDGSVRSGRDLSEQTCKYLNAI